MIQQPTLPVQQAAVQQQFQQQPQLMAAAQPMPEFNAIKININGANVTAPSQQPVAAAPAQAQNINYLA